MTFRSTVSVIFPATLVCSCPRGVWSLHPVIFRCKPVQHAFRAVTGHKPKISRSSKPNYSLCSCVSSHADAFMLLKQQQQESLTNTGKTTQRLSELLICSVNAHAKVFLLPFKNSTHARTHTQNITSHLTQKQLRDHIKEIKTR